jgi:hypothetical protein
MKPKSIIIALLLIQTLITPILVQGDQVLEVKTLADMIANVDAIELQFTSNETTGTFGYAVTGTETINTEPAWKIETMFSETGDEQSYTLWIDKTTGKTVQAEIEGEIITGMFAEVYGNITLAFFMGFVYNYWQEWSYQAFIEWDNAAYGTTTSLGSQTQTYAETTLETWGIMYEGYILEDETIDYELEVWYAPTQFGGIMTYMSITASGPEEYHVELELISISLVEEQQVPTDFTEFSPETTPEEPEAEPEEPETETEAEEEPQGGIPGFPIYSVLLAISVVALLSKNKHTLNL